MSKIIKIFLSAIPSVFFLIVFLSFQPLLNTAYADQITIDDSRIKVDHNPKPVYVDVHDLTFEITAKDGILNIGLYYYRIATPDGCQYGSSFDDKTRGTVVTKSSIVIETGRIKCATQPPVPGDYKFELWRGQDDSGVKIVINYPFYVEPVGGGRAPELTPLNQNLGLSETPEVALRNAKAGTTYNFWWDTSKNIFALRYTAPYDGTVGKITIPKDGMPDPDKIGSKKLCMDTGSGLIIEPPILQKCRYQAEFVFSEFPPIPSTTTQPACSSDPLSPTAQESVAIKAINLPKNQDFRAELIVQDDTVKLPQKQNSKDSGIVVLPLAAFLVEGNYIAKLYNASDNKFVCETTFTVGPTKIGTDQAAAKKQTSAVTPCDSSSDNPGIQTAIGCIHTSPVGFVKDFLKFALGISGGLAFLMMLLGSFQMLTSAGNPDTLSAGKERFTSAIIGLLLVIFSILLLQIIGVDILGIPGFK